MKRDAIVISENDSVATALRDLAAGETAVVGIGLGTVSVVVAEPIAFGHKFALRAIARGENVLKYGEVIGRATADIAAGAHAHVQNIESLRGRGDLQGGRP
jgi:altronate dehydratase small subunit